MVLFDLFCEKNFELEYKDDEYNGKTPTRKTQCMN